MRCAADGWLENKECLKWCDCHMDQRNMAQFPAEQPRVIANLNASRDPDDKGACYVERPDQDRVIVTVRSPGEKDESSVSIPLEIFRQLVRPHL